MKNFILFSFGAFLFVNTVKAEDATTRPTTMPAHESQVEEEAVDPVTEIEEAAVELSTEERSKKRIAELRAFVKDCMTKEKKSREECMALAQETMGLGAIHGKRAMSKIFVQRQA